MNVGSACDISCAIERCRAEAIRFTVCTCCSAQVLQSLGDRQTGLSEDHDVHQASDAETSHGLSKQVSYDDDLSPSLCFNGHFPGEPGLAIVYWSKGWWKWWWQLDYWSYKSCKAPVKSSPPTNQHPVFLQAGCPSCRPTNSVKALKGIIRRQYQQ